MKLVMTLLVRDEADVIVQNLQHHLSQGVDHVIVTDNGSTDGTLDLLGGYVRSGVATLIHEPGDDFSQSRWVTRMARLAAGRLEADWVINSDADEFWWGAGGSVKELLAAVPSEVSMIRVPRRNMVPCQDDGRPFHARMVWAEVDSRNERGRPLPPKTCHRGDPLVTVSMGNHRARGPRLDLVADGAGLDIQHFPIRTYQQYETRMVAGGAAMSRNSELPENVCARWRAGYALWQEGGLPAHYERLQLSPDQITRGLEQGELVVDPRLQEESAQLALAHERRRQGTPG